MIVSESEAKNKICPHLDKMCVASECMAWSWHRETTFGDSKLGALAMKPVPKQSKTHGSCSKK